MCLDISVVIIAYNRYRFLKNTLYSLKKQNFEMSRFEVIFVDDSSTDHTPTIQQHLFPFALRYIRTPHNFGIARARNFGTENASGKIIIFLDAEAIVEPNFLAQHYSNHQKYNKAVVTGGNFYKLYSYLLPDFKEWQRQEIRKFMKHNDKFKERVREKLNKRISSKELPDTIKSLASPVKLISREDIKNYKSLRHFSEPRSYELDLIQKLGNEADRCRLSWLFCIGLNHSVKKSFIGEVGGYDENFHGWGSEDYEFGYRLTKAGARYVADPNIHIYHQEHPIQPAIQKEAARNMLYFQKKHPVMDVCIKSLQYIGNNDPRFMEYAVREYYSLCEDHPGRFNTFKDSILRMLRKIAKIVFRDGWPITKLYKKTWTPFDWERMNRLKSERDVIASYGKYKNLVKVFDLLIAV